MDVTAKEANKKRKGMKSPTDEREVPERDSKLVMALARLALQHGNDGRAHARDDNVVFPMPSSGELAKELQWAADKYAETGAQLKKEQGENYKGHPDGKKPDAMLASLLYRVHRAIRTKVGGDSTSALERFVGEEQTPGKEPEGSCTADLASGGGASKPTGRSSCHEVLCGPVQERRNNEVDCSGQRGPRAEHGAASVQADQPAQGHWGGESHKRQETLARWPLDRGRAASENRSPRKSEHEEEEYKAWWSCHRWRVMHTPWQPSRLSEGGRAAWLSCTNAFGTELKGSPEQCLSRGAT